MRVPTGITCSRCNKEYLQDKNGRMHCDCPHRFNWWGVGK